VRLVHGHVRVLVQVGLEELPLVLIEGVEGVVGIDGSPKVRRWRRGLGPLLGGYLLD
jgi:hypothetical protein